MSTMGRIVKHVSLLAIGGVLGVLGIQLTPDIASPVHAFLERLAPTDGSLAVAACTPEMQEDDIFFVTCGGIY